MSNLNKKFTFLLEEFTIKLKILNFDILKLFENGFAKKPSFFHFFNKSIKLT